MPLYGYICEPDDGGCGATTEAVQGYHDKPLKRCKQCRKHKLRRTINAPYFKQEPKTVGSLADAQTAKMKQEVKDGIRKEKPKPPEPWWGTPPKALVTATEKQKNKYIYTGEL